MLKVTAKVTELKHNCGDYRVEIESVSEKIYDCDDWEDALSTVVELFLSADYDYTLLHEYANGGLTSWLVDLEIDNGD